MNRSRIRPGSKGRIVPAMTIFKGVDLNPKPAGDI